MSKKFVVWGICLPPPPTNPKYRGPFFREDEIEQVMKMYIGMDVKIEHGLDSKYGNAPIGKITDMFRGPDGEVISKLEMDDSTAVGRQVKEDILTGRLKMLSVGVKSWTREDYSSYDKFRLLEISLVEVGDQSRAHIIAHGVQGPNKKDGYVIIDARNALKHTAKTKATKMADQPNHVNGVPMDQIVKEWMQQKQAEANSSASAMKEKISYITKFMLSSGIADPDTVNGVIGEMESLVDSNPKGEPKLVTILASAAKAANENEKAAKEARTTLSEQEAKYQAITKQLEEVQKAQEPKELYRQPEERSMKRPTPGAEAKSPENIFKEFMTKALRSSFQEGFQVDMLSSAASASTTSEANAPDPKRTEMDCSQFNMDELRAGARRVPMEHIPVYMAGEKTAPQQ